MHDKYLIKFTWKIMLTYLTLNAFELIDSTWLVDNILYLQRSSPSANMVSSIDIDSVSHWWVTNYFWSKFLDSWTNYKIKKSLVTFNTTLRFSTIPIVIILHIFLVECDQAYQSTPSFIIYFNVLRSIISNYPNIT